MIDKPQFCPNNKCSNSKGFYGVRKKRWFCKWGMYRAPKREILFRNRNLPARNFNRYKCSECSRVFTRKTFELSYRERKHVDNETIFELLHSGMALRQIGRVVGCSEHLIRIRIRKMAKWAYAFHSEKARFLNVTEAIVVDGLENFSGSQFNPNNVNIAIGSESLFLYDFSFSPLNRKGYMSATQTAVERSIRKTEGSFPSDSIFLGFKELATRLINKVQFSFTCGMPPNSYSNRIVFRSDRHFQYRRALKEIRKDLKKRKIYKKVEHEMTSAKEYRNYQNPLFQVNHCDLLTRHHLKAFTRETIAFSKTAPAMIDRFVLFLIWKNYMRPLFVKTQKFDFRANQDTPAMRVNLSQNPLVFNDVFCERYFPLSNNLSGEWDLFFAATNTFKRGFKFPFYHFSQLAS